jgi:Xaa-Pro aminopeptidase
VYTLLVCHSLQKMIFEAVAAMQSAVMDAMKPGVAWPSMHELSYRVLCEHLTVSVNSDHTFWSVR